MKVKPTGQRTFLKTKIKPSAKGGLNGIRSIFLRFFDGRLYQTEIFYHKGSKPQDLSAFSKDYSTRNRFPFDHWKIKYGYAVAKCAGFTLRADTILNPHIEITDELTLEKVKRAEKAKKKSKVNSGT